MSILSDLVKELEAFLSKEVVLIEEVAEKLLPELEQKVEIALEDLATIAGKAVLQEAPKLISGQDKFENAVTVILNTVESQGKTVVLNTAKAVVQLAYVGAQDVAKKGL